jgi:putative ABC transport system substrate-binding protein
VLGAALHELGWIEGQNLIIERREVDGGRQLLGSFAEQLVQLKVEIIVTNGTEAALAAKDATRSIPIVMFSVGDPVRTGLVASLARPGGNITGYSIVSPESEVKRLALLRELLPTARRIGVLVNPRNLISDVVRKESERAYHSLGMQPIFVEVLGPDDLVDKVAEVARRQGHAMVVGADPPFMTNRVALMQAALTYALPTVVEVQVMADAGALVSYHVSWWEQCRRHAAFIDRILRGAKPADLPIEQPTHFELIINVKTAKALGIVVPQTLLSRADEVIQ